MRRGQFAQALPCLQKAVDQDPGSAETLASLGLVYSKLGDSAKALACYEKSLAMDSTNPIILNIAGALHYNAGKYDRAGELLERAIALKPRLPEPLYNLGLVLLAQGQKDEALAFFEKALAVAPTHGKSLRGKSLVLAERKRTEEARACLKEALLIDDAKMSFAIGRWDRAVAISRQEALRHPDNLRVLSNLGGVLCATGKLEESVEVYRKAVVLDPDNAGLHVRLATTLLAAGDFENGWEEYEWRIKAGYLRAFRGSPDKKQWDGRRMEQGTLLIVCEQGLGDAIQFSRYLPLVKERSGANVKVVCWPSLARLFEQTWKGQLTVCERLPSDSEFDCYLPMMSLPRLFGTVSSAPYLKADDQDIRRWSSRVSALKGRKIGLSWAGNPLHKQDVQRSVAFKLLKPLLKMENTSFVSLQKANAPAPAELAGIGNFHDWTAELKDFADTAALISCLNLVISVDSAVAHLSGALGRKTWTLIPFIPEWRWMRDTESTPWYPSMRLVRQQQMRGWSGVIRPLADELRKP